MKWVTWENVGVDRIGCAWLIRKHIDPQAAFVFIPRGASIPQDAEAFDIPGVELSHHEGHCSFHAILKRHKIRDPVLERLARVIDEADTIQEVLVEPAAAGLDLICEGLRRISVDDQTAVDRGALIYEALYAGVAAEIEQTSESVPG